MSLNDPDFLLAAQKASDYVRSFLSPDPKRIQIEDYSPLVGRILRGKVDSDFETMTNEPAKRRTIQLMDGQGLQELLGKTSTEQLLHIGYDRSYIESLLSSGHSFRLLVFPKKGSPAHRAYWSETLEVCADAWPEVSIILRNSLMQMRKWPFEYWEMHLKMAIGMTFKELKAKPDHPWHMTVDRLSNMTGAVSGIFIRIFLYLNAFLTELYSGDGFTWNESGTRGLPEYISLNRKISELPSPLIIAMPKPVL